jgi:propionate CoA-transferase
MAQIVTRDEAAQLIKDGDTVAFSGFGLACVNQETIEGLEQRFLAEGAPRDLTLLASTAVGARGKREGLSKLAHEGLVKRFVGGILSAAPDLGKLAVAEKIECYNLPQGVITALYRETAAGRPGVITRVGLGTFVDPRIEGGKVNASAVEDIVELVELAGEEYLFYKAMPIDVALIRGTQIDELGNLTMEEEGLKMEVLPIAQAARNSGGIVIAQAKTLVKRGSLDPNLVRVPCHLIDYIVLTTDPELHMQTEWTQYNPAYSGQAKVPTSSFKPSPLNERRVIARRATAELRRGDIINLGVGVPAEVGVILAEEGVADYTLLTTEAGAVGGTAAGDRDFGHSYNAYALMDMHAQFDFYDGGGLDVTVLGLAQADARGNLNASKFNGKVAGCGGFINITATAKRVVFGGTFTASGLVEEFGDGKLTIVTEGKIHKFVQAVEQITFSGEQAARRGQSVVYVTERCVMELRDGRMTLIEIAPGIDLQRDVLDQMDFVPAIADDLKTMDPGLFNETWGGLKATIDAAEAARLAV